ncbi:MAG: M81 family metallopeptidase [Polyangiaceae bacterium]
MIKQLFSRSSGRPLRIAYGRLFHEANAFSPIRTTTRDFESMHLLRGDDLAKACTLRGTELLSFMPHAELTGFTQAARLAGNVTVIPTLSALAVPGGPLTRACFDELCEELLSSIEAALPLDGVYLALHGSMQVDDLEGAPEAHLLRRVRARLGESAKIAVSYDLHANLSEGLVDPVDVLIAYRTNPHWDLAPTGFRAGSRLIRALRGDITPVHAWRKLPMVLGGGTTIDFMKPMNKVFRYMKNLERDPRVISASLFMVHPYTNAEELGWAVHVSTDGDPALAAKVADDLASKAWEQRKVEMPEMRSVGEALDLAKKAPSRRIGPVTLVDVDDIVGAGAPGGNTRIVEELVKNDRGLAAFVPVHDPGLVGELWDTPHGAKRNVVLRGTEGYGSPPVELAATVLDRTTNEYGKCIRLDVGSFHVVITERGPLPIHPRFWSAVGLSARHADVIVQKNFFHYRMFHLTHSFTHIPVVSEGATSFSRVRAYAEAKGLYPAKDLADWRTFDRETRETERQNERARAVSAHAPARVPFQPVL